MSISPTLPSLRSRGTSKHHGELDGSLFLPLVLILLEGPECLMGLRLRVDHGVRNCLRLTLLFAVL